IPVADLNGDAERAAAAGQTPVYVAIGGQLAGLICVADPIKPEATVAIQQLRAQGMQVAMITGDVAGTAQAVADQLGIDHVISDVLPEGKLRAVTELQSRFGPTAFVGDGINDAPALAAADIGIALGTGADVAVESADVVLMSGKMSAVASAFAVSRQTMRNIKQNLFWAFAYNIALIPVAAGALYLFAGPLLSPMLAAGAMAASSVFVVSNALRLRRVGQA
ncbi:MAG: HAD-IC family P-type ATPase, partial [Pseudomonadota bacterium]